MTEAQAKFVELEKQKEAIKKWYEEFAEAVKAVVDEVGVGGMFQDPEGTVYEMTEPDGRYVYYDKYYYKRTKREGEKRGELSMKKAEEAGFKVK